MTKSKAESKSKTEKVAIGDLVADPDINPRDKIRRAFVEEYAQAMREGALFPPLTVFRVDGRLLLVDGFHRREAAILAGELFVWCEIVDGTRSEAIAYAAGSNASHGLRRSNADKKRAVEIALKDPELRKKTDPAIADICCVSRSLVQQMRRVAEGTPPSPSRCKENRPLAGRMHPDDIEAIAQAVVNRLATSVLVACPVSETGAMA